MDLELLTLHWPIVPIRGRKIKLIEPVLEKAISSKRGVLICFDFAYAYPVLQAATGRSDHDLPWLTLWQYLSENRKDDEYTAPGAKPSNRSNRFEVADRINALLSQDANKTGPFWCASEEAGWIRSIEGGCGNPAHRGADVHRRQKPIELLLSD